MCKLRRMGAVAIITVALSVPAFAGIIDSPGAPAPTPSQTSSTSTSMTTVVLTILSLIR